MIYEAVNEPLLQRVPPGLRRVLDLGCGTGVFGEFLRARRPGCKVLGVTFSEVEAEAARPRLDGVLVRDLDHFDPAEVRQQPGFEAGVDGVICSHVLEHLLNPAALLRALPVCLTPSAEGAAVVVGLPNVMLWKQRWQFLQGRFRYTEGGIMDGTHRAFYDWDSARALLTDNGFRLESAVGNGAFPQPGLRRLLGPSLSARLDEVALRRFPNVFGYQFIMVARPAAGAPAV